MTDLVVTPDFTRLVAVGMGDVPPQAPGGAHTHVQDGGGPGPGHQVAGVGAGAGAGAGAGGNGAQVGTAGANKNVSEPRIIIYDLATKQPET